MKTIIKSALCTLLTILLLSPEEATADELVRRLGMTTNSKTIIRHLNNRKDIVCYNDGCPYFTIYEDGSPTTHMIYLNRMYEVNDFEIYDGTIYFCGRYLNPVSGNAMIGYFDVASFLSPTAPVNVSYVALPSMEVVKAIEVGWFAARKHVVGIGEGNKAESIMVDMIDETTYWNVNFGNVGGDTMILSDLAITDSFVVATATKTSSTYFVPTGYLWYFNKTLAPGQDLFSLLATYKQHTGIRGLKYLVLHLVGDSFVTAYHDLGYINTNPVTLSYFNGLNYDYSLSLDEEAKDSFFLQDIQKDIPTWTVEVLMSGRYTYPSGSSVKSKIIETPNVYPVPSTAFAHYYDGLFLTSIDRFSSQTIGYGHFVLSGYDRYHTSHYMKFRLWYFGGSCLSKVEQPIKEKTVEHIEKKRKVDNIHILQLPEEELATKKPVSVETKCYHHSPELENE